MTSSAGSASTVANNGQLLDQQFPLHHAVFHNDVPRLKVLLRQSTGGPTEINRRDTHGNTPLYIANMLGHRACIELLLAHGATIQTKNNLGWSSMDEARSYGDRRIVKMMLIQFDKQMSHKVKADLLNSVSAHLSNLPDFYMETKMELISWIPLLSRALPSETLKIYKKGHRLRIDFTLVNFKERMLIWERGDSSLLLDMTATNGRKAVVMDHKRATYQVLRGGKVSHEMLLELLDLKMQTDIFRTKIDTQPIRFVQAKTFLQFPKTEKIGNYKANLYHIKGMKLVTMRRREHLTPEDIKRNRRMMRRLSGESSNGSDVHDSNSEGSETDDEDAESNRRRSLEPPPRPKMNWHQYLRASDENSHLGRQMRLKETHRDFNGMVAMSNDFPLSLNVVLDILKVLEPINPAVGKLRQVCNARLPNGFPVRIEMPVFPAIQARITFQSFKWSGAAGRGGTHSDSLFRIPSHYREENEQTNGAEGNNNNNANNNNNHANNNNNHANNNNND